MLAGNFSQTRGPVTSESAVEMPGRSLLYGENANQHDARRNVTLTPHHRDPTSDPDLGLGL
jgi:hypothetical protein